MYETRKWVEQKRQEELIKQQREIEWKGKFSIKDDEGYKQYINAENKRKKDYEIRIEEIRKKRIEKQKKNADEKLEKLEAITKLYGLLIEIKNIKD